MKNSSRFRCHKTNCRNVPIKMYKFKNTFFYICSQHLFEFENKHLPKLLKNNDD